MCDVNPSARVNWNEFGAGLPLSVDVRIGAAMGDPYHRTMRSTPGYDMTVSRLFPLSPHSTANLGGTRNQVTNHSHVCIPYVTAIAQSQT